MPRCLGYNSGPIGGGHVTHKTHQQPKINLINDQHRNSHDNIVATTLLSNKLQSQKHRIRIIKIIVQLVKDQHGAKFPTRIKHD